MQETWFNSWLGRSVGEGIGYPFQYSWTSLVAQLVKNPPAMRETWVRSLGGEHPLEKGKGYPLQYSGLENSMDYTVHGVSKSQTLLSDFQLSLSMIQLGFPGGSDGKESICNVGDLGSIPSQEDPIEKGMATHSTSILAWRIPWTEEPDRLQSMGSQRLGHNWATITPKQLYNKFLLLEFLDS